MQRFDLDPTTLSREETVTFPGPAGDLEGLWRPPRPGREPRAVVVVAHPHPAHGGTMLNKVVFHTARVLNHDLQAASLRFNYRGVGASAGAYDEGRGEVEDLAAAWTEARRRAPGVPLVAAGFSFGAAMTLLLAARTRPQEFPIALALLGIPPSIIRLPDSVTQGPPLAAVHGRQDQFTTPEVVTNYLAGWPALHSFHVVENTDHFFEGHIPEATAFLSRRVREWMPEPGVEEPPA